MKRTWPFVLLMLFFSAFTSHGNFDAAAYSQTPDFRDGETMTAVSAFGGMMRTFAVSGNYAYVSEGMSFVVFDISTPSAPEEVGRTLLPDMAWEIDVVGTYAYVAAWSKGLQVVDISDPTAPAVVGSWWRDNSGSWAYAVGVGNGYAYLGGNDVIMVLNIANPATPVHVNDVAGNFWAREMDVAGSTLYIAGSSGGLVTYNVSNPTTPTLLGTFNPSGYGYTDGLALAGPYAYLADGSYGLRIVNISNPAAPIQVGKYPPEGYQHPGDFKKVALGGNFAYVTDIDLGLWVIDVSSSGAPAYQSDVPITGGISEVAFAGNHVFASESQFQIFNPAVGTTAPALVGAYKSLDEIEVLQAQGNLLLAASRTGNDMYRLDISNPASLRKTADYGSLNGCEAIQIQGHTAYVGGGNDENLKVFDLLVPNEITYKGYLNTAGFVWRLAASGSMVFIGDGSNGVVTADAANPAAPVQLDTYNTNFTNDIAYGNGYVYVADGSEQIIVLNANNPANLTYVTAYDITSDRVVASGNYLVTRGTTPSTFSILDMTNPALPVLKSTTYTPFYLIKDIAVQDDSAYILGTFSGGGAGSGLLVYNISNPSGPGLMARYDMPAGPWRVTVSGQYTYVALGGRGLLALKMLMPLITQITPDLGAAGWTTLVNIYGDGFAEGAVVTFGETAAAMVTVVSETHIQALAPAGLTPGTYNVRVTNPNGFGHTLTNAFEVVDATADGVFAASEDLFTTPAPPRATEKAGLALHVHRFGGTADLYNFTVDFYEGDPDRGGTLIGTGTVATLPPDGTGTTSAVNWTPTYAMDTNIYAVLGASNVKVHRKITVSPSSTDPYSPTISSVRINGGTGSQDTTSRTVTLQFNAKDVGSGLNTMWVAEWMWNPGLGAWQVVQEQKWIPYESTMEWTLSGPPGSRFIDVWVADFAGNISNKAEKAHINLLYADMWVAQGQTQIFNYELNAGQPVSIQVTPASGDPDLYVGTYDDGILYSSYKSGSEIESITFNAPRTDWYSFIVYGYTNAMYNVAINRAALPNGWKESLGGAMRKTTPAFELACGGPPTQMGLPAAPVDYQSSPTIIYVSNTPGCGGNDPCYTRIQNAVNDAGVSTLIRIANGIYDGAFTLNTDKSPTIEGGWDPSFNYRSGVTTLLGAPKSPYGSLTLWNLNINAK